MKKNYYYFIRSFFLLLSFLFYSGCSTINNIKDDLKKEKNLVTIHGNVTIANDLNAPIIIVLLKNRTDFLEFIDYKIKKKSGAFTFRSQEGKYAIYAWQDLNHNNKYDVNEPIGATAVSKYVSGVNTNSNIIIKNPSLSLFNKLNEDKKKQMIDPNRFHMHIGSVISLDDESFSEANISSGMLEPYTSLEKIPYGLFFLEKYSPKKKIILFIHGINGSPKNFRTIIENINTDKYQILLYYYPSGLRLSIVSEALVEAMEELYVKTKYQKVSLIAHSMGGLIARDYINRLKQKGDNYIDTFISISTPWGGHKSAETGLKYSPIVLSVWQDMAPNSNFLNKLLIPQLVSSTPFYLLFSYHGGNIIEQQNNDGVVSIKSQLRYEAQEESKLVRGFDENHMSILRNKQVYSLIQNLLNKVY